MPEHSTSPMAPFWQVVGVFDNEGTGGNFAYTVGLHGAGHPELHMWANPTHGTDPGEDWKFNPREQAILLNGLAHQLLEGSLAPGDTIVRPFDGGAAEVAFTVGDPVEPESVDAFQVEDGATVLPVRWELRRAPEGEIGPVDDGHVDAVLHHVATLRSHLGTDAAVPDRWQLPAEPVTDEQLDPAGEFGPLTPLVIAQGAAIAAADARVLTEYLENAIQAEQYIGPRAVLGLTSAAARPVGRRKAVEAVRAAATELVDHIAGKDEPTRKWRDVVEALGGAASPAETEEFSAALRHLLSHAVAATLTTATLDDIADQQLRRAGYGPWAWASCELDAPAGWEATPEAAARVADLISGLDDEGVRHLAQVATDALGDEAYFEIYHSLRGLAVTCGGGLPELFALFGPDASAAVAGLDNEERAGVRAGLELLVAATHHSATLSETRRAPIVATYAEVLDRIEATLSAPTP